MAFHPGLLLSVLMTQLTLAGCFLERATFTTEIKGLRHPGLASMILVETSQTEGRVTHYFSSGDNSLYVESWTVSDESVAQIYSLDRSKRLASLFAAHKSPYPGAISKRAGCLESLRPKSYRWSGVDMVSWAFEVMAGDRRNYGVCIPEQIRYKSIYAIVYCANTKIIYDLRYFVPKDAALSEGEAFLEQFSCVKG